MFSGKIEDYILFEDKEIIVCRKPAGIAVQNARIGAMDLESSLKNYLAMQDGFSNCKTFRIRDKISETVLELLL